MRRHIMFVNIPMKGHVYPTLPVVTELVRRGHRVSYATTAERAATVTAVGGEVVPYATTRPTDSDGSLQQPDHGAFLSEVMLAFMQETEAILPQLDPWVAEQRPDVIVHDRLAFAGRLLAAKHAIPGVQLWPMLASAGHWSIVKELGGFDPAQPAYVEFLKRREALLESYCTPMSLDEFYYPQGHRHISFYTRSFQYEGDGFGDNHAFVGPCLGSRPFHAPWLPPEDGRRVVMVSLGTIYNQRLGFFRAAVDGFADGDWLVVLLVGERIEPRDLGPIPEHVEVHPSVHQLDVLSRASVFVSAAGVGGIMEALHFGVPQVVLPVTPEQEVNARRVAALGLGLQVPIDGVTATVLRDAVEQVAKDAEVARRVAVMRHEVRSAGGAGAAADLIEAAC